MDRAYCVSLQREVGINEVGELYRQGLIADRGDFACLDPKCRAGYVCVNLGKSTFKVSPHFKTAINADRSHADGCAYEVECKIPVAIEMGRPRKPRLSITADCEIIFGNARPKKYFAVPGKFNGMRIDVTSPLKYIPSGYSETSSGAANPKCYSIENLLNGGWDSRQKIVLDGYSGVVKSTFVPIDNNVPDMYRRYIYCGLAKSTVSDDKYYTFRFGRSFSDGVRLVDVYLKIAQPIISASFETRSPYYRELIDRVITAARESGKYPNNPLFLYALGCPKLDKELGGFVLVVENLDHFYIASRGDRQGVVSPVYSNLEVNQHYFAR